MGLTNEEKKRLFHVWGTDHEIEKKNTTKKIEINYILNNEHRQFGRFLVI